MRGIRKREIRERLERDSQDFREIRGILDRD